MLWLRTWYRLLTQQHLLGVGGESRKQGWMPLRWLQSSGCPWSGGRWERCCSDWLGFLWVSGRRSEAALSCHPSSTCLPPLLPGSCSTIKVSIAHLKCEMRAQWEEVACSFVPWCMKRPHKMQMDWRRPCGLVATTGSEECEPNSWQDQRCGFAVGLQPACYEERSCFSWPSPLTSCVSTPFGRSNRSSLLQEVGRSLCSWGTGGKLRLCLPLLLDNSRSLQRCLGTGHCEQTVLDLKSATLPQLWFWICLTIKGISAEAACRDATMTDVLILLGVWRWKCLCTYVTSMGIPPLCWQ